MPAIGRLAAGAAGAAIASGMTAAADGPAGLAAGLAVAAGAVALRSGGRRGDALLLAGAALVLLRVAVGGIVTPAPPAAPVPAGERGWSAEVVALGSVRDGAVRAGLLLRPADAPADDAMPIRVHARLPRDAIVLPGDRFAITGTVEPAPTDGSPFAEYLARGGYAGTLRTTTLPVVAHADGPMAAVAQLRAAAAAAIARGVPSPEAGLAAGILVGAREGLDRGVAEDFATTGLGHLVAISGWNIALVAGLTAALALRLPLGLRGRTLLVIALIGGYALLTGASAGVLRAALMGAVVAGARAAGRPGSAGSALALAVLVLIAADPAIAEDIGFQLSVLATAGLLVWAGPLTERLGRVAGGRLPGWLCTTLGVSLAAQAATLPVVLFHFGRISFVSPAANLAAAPLVVPAMAASLAGLVAGVARDAGVPDALLAPAALSARLVLGGLVAIADGFASLPLASVTLPPPLDLASAGAVAALCAIALRRTRRDPGPRPTAAASDAVPAAPGAGGTPGAATGRGRIAPRTAALATGVGVAALVAGIALSGAGRPDGRTQVTVLDVGQGDAILLEEPGGGRILVDGGPDPDRLLRLLDARLPPWDRRIDLAILTHPHEDHAAGLPELLARYRIGRIAENGMRGRGPGDAALRLRLAAEGRLGGRLAAGDRIALGTLRIDVLWPPRDSLPEVAPGSGRAVNDTSLVLDVRAGSRRFLLTGDVEDDIDATLLAAGVAAGGRVDLLKVAHHGSATATTDPLIAALRPRVAVASAGSGNPYGHPAPETLARLAAAGARVLRTDRDGSVTVSTDGRDLRLAADRTAGVAAPGDRRTAGAPVAGPCRIPGAPVLRDARLAPAPLRDAATRPGARGRRAAVAAAPDDPRAASARPCYDRWRDDPVPRPGGAPPPRPGRSALARPPHGRRRGDRGGPGGAGRRARGRRGPAARRGRGPPP